jgi:hypothetical protein
LLQKYEENNPENFCGMIAGLFMTNTDASKWKASHVKAVASVDGKEFFDIGVALFDT